MLKAKSNIGVSNIQRPPNKPKKPNTGKDDNLVPESTKGGAKKLEEGGEAKPGETLEEVKEEPKKPRYFPPRRLPNPFENAA